MGVLGLELNEQSTPWLALPRSLRRKDRRREVPQGLAANLVAAIGTLPSASTGQSESAP